MTKHPTLVPVDVPELQVVLDALVAYAYQCEAEGEPYHSAAQCDAIAERIRALIDLASEDGREFLKHRGFGAWKHRPQG